MRTFLSQALDRKFRLNPKKIVIVISSKHVEQWPNMNIYFLNWPKLDETSFLTKNHCFN